MKRSLILLAAFFVAHRVAAQAPAAWSTCSVKSGTLVIRYAPDLADAKPPLPKTVVRFMSLLDLDKAGTTVEGTRARSFTCHLKSDRFDVTLEPGVANPNLLGRCGDAVTGIVTVRRNGTVVLDEQEFEAINCHERERFIARITFRDGSPKPALVYSGY